MSKHFVDINVNGVMRSIQVKGNWTLLKVLRDELDLTGTKCGCDEGQCGACTVLVDGKPVLACLTLAAGLHGKEVTTIEGVGLGGNLAPLQESFVKHHALQCGFCTPGMILLADDLLHRNPHPSEAEIGYELRGNLCRCGTYPNVTKAIQTVARKREKRDDE